MVKETTYCDRCGKKCEGNRNNRGFHIYRKYFAKKLNEDVYLDFCQECYDKFAEWMNGKNDIKR